jgi:hypothetical protein
MHKIQFFSIQGEGIFLLFLIDSEDYSFKKYKC